MGINDDEKGAIVHECGKGVRKNVHERTNLRRCVHETGLNEVISMTRYLSLYLPKTDVVDSATIVLALVFTVPSVAEV